MPLTGSKRHRKATSKRFWGVTVLLTCTLILSACGDDEGSGPQFVSDVRPTSISTQTVSAPTPTATIPPTEQATSDPGSVISTRSAPRFAYLIIDGALTSYDSAGRTFTTIQLPADLTLIGHAASPTGDRVGVLGVQNSRLIVQFFGADGAALTEAIPLSVPSIPRVESSPSATPGATPATAVPVLDTANQLHIDWIPQGNAVTVSGPGVNQRVSMSGEVMPISRTGVAGTVMRSIWSPMDLQVAIQTQLQNGDQSVYLLDTGHDEARPLEAFENIHGQGLSNLQWMPSGLGLIAVMGDVENGVVMIGQLYVYRFDAETPSLIATSGLGGPSSTITHAVVSPDGHSIAYAVMVRDLNTWHLHSLWVRSMKSGPAVTIPTDSGSPITSLQWTEEGIVWQQADGTLMVVDDSLNPRPLGTSPVATPVVEASPAATPIDELVPVG
ncbi:MAG: hypothetical protein M9953_05500 [Thermomicrobiales bacterium]|nr:hypothetical protein [Thermomicrobiales bacterium]